MSTTDEKNTLAMTAHTIGADLLQALVQEIKLLPDVWPKMSQAKQDDVIDRLRKRVITNVQMATHLIASDGRVTVVAELEQITVKDGIKAVLTMSKNDPNRHGLIDCQGKTVLIALADAEAHMGEVAAVRGQADQRAMDLGHEYDPSGDGKGMDGPEPGPGDDVSDARILTLGDGPLESEKEKAFQDGYHAAEEGKPKTECPMFRHELVAEWTAGWSAWHEENDDPSAATGDAEAA
jgi:ribosome modulation factor